LGHAQQDATRIFEDNASCILMSENPANAERSRHIDTRVWFLRDMVRDGILKLQKCSGLQNVADALTKSLPSPSFFKHRTYLWGSRIPFEAFRVKILQQRPTQERASWLAQCARAAAA